MRLFCQRRRDVSAAASYTGWSEVNKHFSRRSLSGGGGGEAVDSEPGPEQEPGAGVSKLWRDQGKELIRRTHTSISAASLAHMLTCTRAASKHSGLSQDAL